MGFDSYTVSTLEGLAQLLTAAGAGEYRGQDGVFTPGVDDTVRAITIGGLPSYPTQAISLTRYLDVPDIVAINHVRVQVASRVGTNPFEGVALTDLIRDTLHDKNHVVLNGVHFNRVVQESIAELGPDGNGRFEYTQNFALTGNRYGV